MGRRWVEAGSARALATYHGVHAHPRRHPQRGDRGPRGPRQDHAGRRDALAVRRLPSEPGGGRTRHGLDRPRAREGHHDPGEEHRRPPRRSEDQHHRHAGARGLRRRGRTRAHDGGRRPAAGRRLRGAVAADAVRPAQVARVAPAGDPGREQDRPTRRAHDGGRGRGLPAVPGPRRRRAPDRVPDPVRRRARGPMRSDPVRSARGSRTAVRRAPPPHPRALLRDGPPPAGARDQPRRLALRREARALSRAQRHDPPGSGGRVVPLRRVHRARQGRRALRHRRARSRRGRGGRARRDRRGRRHRRDHDRGDARRSRRPAPAPGHPRGRAVPVDDDRHQHLAAVGQGRDQAHRAPGEVAVGSGSGRQRVDPRPRRRPPRPLGGAGPRRAAARGAGRGDAPGGVRAHGRQAAGRHARDRRHAARTRRARGDRRARGVPRRDHTAARPPKGAAGEHGEPRHRVDPHGAPGPRARSHRVPDRVPHRDARHGAAPPRVRGVRAVARRPPNTADRFPRRRPGGRLHDVHPAHAPGARIDVRRARRGRVRGDDRRGERPRRGHRREPDEGEEAHQHAAGELGGVHAPDPQTGARPRAGARVHPGGRVRRGDAAQRTPAQGGAPAAGTREGRSTRPPGRSS